MRMISGKKVKSLVLVMLFSISITGFSQSMKEAVDAFNEGASLTKSNPDGAIKAFEKCIGISEKLGDEGKDTKEKAEQQLPLLYYTVALNSYKKKDFDAAISGLNEAKAVADKYGNQEISAKSEKIVPQFYYAKGSSEYKNKDYDAALASLDKAAELNPKYAKPYLVKATIYKAQNDTENMLMACDKAIEVGASGDKKTAESAEKLAKNTMFNDAVAAIGAKNWDEAETSLKKSIEYGNDTPDVHYQLGKVYVAQKKWDPAITSLNTAVQGDQGDAVAKAKYYYELGNAFVGKGDNTSACDSFKKAQHGEYAQNAKYQIETVLKCN